MPSADFWLNEVSLFYSVVLRGIGNENDAVSPPVLVTIVGIDGIGSNRSELIVLEVSGTNNQLGFEEAYREVYRDGPTLQRLKQNTSESLPLWLKICQIERTCWDDF